MSFDKIIDFRARPPIAEYLTFFTPELVARINKGVGAPTAPSFANKSLELFFEEMDQAGINTAVMNGRHRGGTHVEDAMLSEMHSKYEGRLIGLAGTNLEKPMDEILPGIETAIKKLSLKGVTVEPGFASTPMYPDDEKLFPIYEKCIELDVPTLIMSGPFAGPDLGYTHPIHYERVALNFPKLNIVAGHGCYPYVTEAIAMIYKCNARGANIYISPDCYMFMPGRDMYIEGINRFPENFIFGTAYPFRPIVETVKEMKEFAIEESAWPKYLYENIAKLFKMR